MKVLIACEKSGEVREAFASRGHDAWSCDLEPTERPGQHIQADHDLHIFNIIDEGEWDLLIAHPPCTHLAVSGARYFAEKRADGRQQEAFAFFMAFTKTRVPKYAIENPVAIISTLWRKPDQIIQPYHFGHPESKKTCLWLKGLPMLRPTKICEPTWYQNPDGTDYRDRKGKRYSPTHFLMGRNQVARWENQTASGQNRLGPSPTRAAVRARTYPGIAAAMADQWGGQ